MTNNSKDVKKVKKIKKKKLSVFKKDRMREFIFDLIENRDHFLEYDISTQDLYHRIMNSKTIKSFRHIGKFDFFNTKYDNKSSTLIVSTITFDIDKKDSIEINEQVVNSIDFLEKIFISLDDINIYKYNNYEEKTHIIIIKVLKNQTPEEIYKNLKITT